MKRLPHATAALALLAALTACTEAEVEDGASDAFPSGKADGGIDDASPEAIGVLRLVNDPAQTAAALKSGAGITSRVAGNIVKHRDGGDGVAGTADDDAFDTLAELDAIPYVGPATLNALVEYAREKGYVGGTATLDVMFSPVPAASSHNARIAQWIRGAQHSIDIAVYSYSDPGIASALLDRAQHGVKIRFIFDTASEDRKLTDPAARAASRSGKLEAMGIDVRWMNKTMHHKFVIVDGPRDVRERVTTAKLAMGSANWSVSAATDFDENTVFVEGSVELVAGFQHEFDSLWLGSRDFVGPAPAQGLSTVKILPREVADDAGIEALFTSGNFTAGGPDGTTWRVDRKKMALTDAWNAAIDRAQTSIHVATTHMRLRPYAEKLAAKKAANPSLDIKVYLDQQEYISPSGDTLQRAEVDTCLVAATTEIQRFECLYNNFLFSKMLVDAGIELRFKSYAYRWDHGYAPQMHSKYMVVDGKEVLTGSFNASMNAEQSTFESGLHVFGAAYTPLVAKFEQNFVSMWDLGRGQLAGLRAKIANDATFPLVFPSMALTYQEFGDLRALIRANCAQVDSEAFRTNPGAHRTCTR